MLTQQFYIKLIRIHSYNINKSITTFSHRLLTFKNNQKIKIGKAEHLAFNIIYLTKTGA